MANQLLCVWGERYPNLRERSTLSQRTHRNQFYRTHSSTLTQNTLINSEVCRVTQLLWGLGSRASNLRERVALGMPTWQLKGCNGKLIFINLSTVPSMRTLCNWDLHPNMRVEKIYSQCDYQGERGRHLIPGMQWSWWYFMPWIGFPWYNREWGYPKNIWELIFFYR